MQSPDRSTWYSAAFRHGQKKGKGDSNRIGNERIRPGKAFLSKWPIRSDPFVSDSIVVTFFCVVLRHDERLLQSSGDKGPARSNDYRAGSRPRIGAAGCERWNGSERDAHRS